MPEFMEEAIKKLDNLSEEEFVILANELCLIESILEEDE